MRSPAEVASPFVQDQSRAEDGVTVLWVQPQDVLDLCNSLAFGGCRHKDAAYEDVRSFSPDAFARISHMAITQQVVHGPEARTIESYFAASLVSAVRDFTESEGRVDSALDGVPVAAWVGSASPALRTSMRRQVRRTLDSPIWMVAGDTSDLPTAGFTTGRPERSNWECQYCGEPVNCGEGYGRLNHMASHPAALPARRDFGCAVSRRFARNLVLLLMALLVRGRSWPRHREYFAGTGALAMLDAHSDGGNNGMAGFEACATSLQWSLGYSPHLKDWAASSE